MSRSLTSLYILANSEQVCKDKVSFSGRIMSNLFRLDPQVNSNPHSNAILCPASDSLSERIISYNTTKYRFMAREKWMFFYCRTFKLQEVSSESELPKTLPLLGTVVSSPPTNHILSVRWHRIGKDLFTLSGWNLFARSMFFYITRNLTAMQIKNYFNFRNARNTFDCIQCPVLQTTKKNHVLLLSFLAKTGQA